MTCPVTVGQPTRMTLAGFSRLCQRHLQATDDMPGWKKRWHEPTYNKYCATKCLGKLPAELEIIEMEELMGTSKECVRCHRVLQIRGKGLCNKCHQEVEQTRFTADFEVPEIVTVLSPGYMPSPVKEVSILDQIRALVVPVCAEQTMIDAILTEFHRAKIIHPAFPDDVVHRVSIMMEEAGETVQAVNNYHFHDGELDAVRRELIQTGAMVLRCLESLG